MIRVRGRDAAPVIDCAAMDSSACRTIGEAITSEPMPTGERGPRAIALRVTRNRSRRARAFQTIKRVARPSATFDSLSLEEDA